MAVKFFRPIFAKVPTLDLPSQSTRLPGFEGQRSGDPSFGPKLAAAVCYYIDGISWRKRISQPSTVWLRPLPLANIEATRNPKWKTWFHLQSFHVRLRERI